MAGGMVHLLDATALLQSKTPSHILDSLDCAMLWGVMLVHCRILPVSNRRNPYAEDYTSHSRGPQRIHLTTVR